MPKYFGLYITFAKDCGPLIPPKSGLLSEFLLLDGTISHSVACEFLVDEVFLWA